MEVMSHELICSWLELSEGEWPPDHYRLLGLKPGEADTALIEQRLQQRLESVRRYQMMYPELATEAMNRLAQAFICLTEPASKRQYDAALQRKTSPATPALPSDDTVVQKIDDETWVHKAPPPAQRPEATPPAATNPPPLPVKPPPVPVKPPPLPPLPPLVQRPEGAPEVDPAPTILVTPSQPRIPVFRERVLPQERIDPILEAARCAEARRGLSSRPAILRRLRLTRQLLRLWDRVGKLVSSPHKRLKRPAQAEEIDRDLAEIESLLRGFPSCLGHAGQPGYQVVSLASMQLWLTFQNMDFQQRQSLSADWTAGRKLLRAYVQMLGEEGRALKRQTLPQRLAHLGWTLCNDRLGLVLFLIALLALNLAVWRSYFPETWFAGR